MVHFVLKSFGQKTARAFSLFHTVFTKKQENFGVYQRTLIKKYKNII